MPLEFYFECFPNLPRELVRQMVASRRGQALIDELDALSKLELTSREQALLLDNPRASSQTILALRKKHPGDAPKTPQTHKKAFTKLVLDRENRDQPTTRIRVQKPSTKLTVNEYLHVPSQYDKDFAHYMRCAEELRNKSSSSALKSETAPNRSFEQQYQRFRMVDYSEEAKFYREIGMKLLLKSIVKRSPECLDFHFLNTSEATDFLSVYMEDPAYGKKPVTIITGKNASDGGSKLQKAILAFCEQNGYAYKYLPGCVTVHRKK